MLQAMLCRKLTRPEECMEDLLTSNTFGLMKYLPPELALLPFLRQACGPLSKRPLADQLNDVAAVKRWRFWPTLSYPGCKPCEPDVEIDLCHEDGSRTRLLIEAKYRSGKSSLAAEVDQRPNDQLAREFDNLKAAAEEEGIESYAVVFITADFAYPKEQLEESAREYREKRSGSPDVHWLTWRVLPSVLDSDEAEAHEIACDLRSLLLELDLTMFCRLRFEGVKIPAWRFLGAATPSWEWCIPALAWLFEAGRSAVASEQLDSATPAFSTEAPDSFRWQLPRSPHCLFHWRAQ